MSRKLLLDGDDWKLAGWWKNQFRSEGSMELNKRSRAPITFINSTVPGAVQVDLMRAGLLEDPNVGLNAMKGEWVNNREWTYVKEFELPNCLEGERYLLTFEGLDYSGEIYLNGQRVTEFEGMFLPVSCDVTDYINRSSKNTLIVLFHQSPEVDGQIGYTSKIRQFKSRFNYVWDWCTRIVPVGIWKSVYLEAIDSVKLINFWPHAQLCDDYFTGIIDVNIDVDVTTLGRYTLECIVSLDEEVVKQVSFKDIHLCLGCQKVSRLVQLTGVKVWWPNNLGDQPLYTVEIILMDEEGNELFSDLKKVGFRRLEFAQNADSPEDSLPYTVLINGRRLFLKGVNWVPISPFYGSVRREDYEKYIGRFKEMNCNIFRVWGGAVPEHSDFYDVCDENGLLVWQDFLQSSSGIDNAPPDDPGYIDGLKTISAEMIRSRRHHVSHVIWCGGNELMIGDYVPVTVEHPNIRMLRDLVRELDPDKLFLPASASGPVFVPTLEQLGLGKAHDVHGHWTYQGPEKHYAYYNKDDALMRSEVGTPGLSEESTIRFAGGTGQVWPPTEDNILWRIHGAWWIMWDELTAIFGKWDEHVDQLGSFVKAGQYLQAESLRYIVEAVSRRSPRSSGVLIWMGNEPYANMSNTSILQYDGIAKPSYSWVRQAFKELHVSCKYDKVYYRVGERFVGTIYLHNSQNTKDVTVEAQLLDLEGVVIESKALSSESAIDSVSPVECMGSIEWDVSSLEGDMFVLRLRLLKNHELIECNDYVYFIGDGVEPMRPLRELEEINIQVKDKSKGRNADFAVEVENTGKVIAVMVYIREKDPNDFVNIETNGFMLLPGEKKEVVLRPFVSCKQELLIKVSAFNLFDDIEVECKR